MANNTTLNLATTGDVISDDQITSLNGGAIGTGEKVQRMKLSFGSPASATDVTASTPFPVTANEGAAITTSVTILQNATVATSNGTSLVVTGYGTAVLQITGTFVATINFEFSTDAGATWNPISATQIGAGDIFQSTTIPGAFRITCTALDLIRARVTWTSGTVTINGRASNAINASKVVKLATGTNIVGKIGIDQTTPGTTNAVSVTSQPELVTTGTITTTDIVVGTPSGTGVLLSGTSTAGSYVAMAASGGNASVVIGITGLTTGTIYYEGSADSTTGIDGNWVALNMKQAGYVNTQISSFTTVNGLFRGNTAGIRYIRMRSVGTLTGTPTITLRLSAGVAGEFLFGSIPTGGNKIGSVDISASVPITTTAAAALNADILASTDVSAYKSVSIQLAGTWSGGVFFKGSNDNVTFYTIFADDLTKNTTITQTNASGGNSLYMIPIMYRYLRIRMESYTSGTATGSAIAYTDDRGHMVTTAIINNSGSNPVAVGFVSGTNIIGGVTPRGFNVNGNTMSSLNSAATTNATLIKASAATVYTISIMNASAASRFIRFYNLTVAPTVGTSVPVKVIAVPATSSKELEFGLGLPFSTGLSFAITAGAAVTDATAGAAGDVQLAISWN